MRTNKKHAIDPDPDIIRSAWFMIRSHGDKALREATRQQSAMIEKGDIKAVSLWYSIGEAIKELRRTKRQQDEPLN